MGGQRTPSKRWFWGLLAAVVIAAHLTIVGCGQQSQAEPATEDPESAAWSEPQRLSYAIGYVVVRRLQERGVPFDIEQVAMGFGDAADHREPRIPVEQMEAAIARLTGRQAAKEATAEAATAQRAREAMAAAAEREAQRREPAPGRYDRGLSLRLDGKIPTGRIDTAVPTTRINALEADNPDLERYRD